MWRERESIEDICRESEHLSDEACTPQEDEESQKTKWMSTENTEAHTKEKRECGRRQETVGSQKSTEE